MCARNRKTFSQDGQKARPARPQRVKARGVPSGYVEGLNDARTMLAGFFTILLYPFDPDGRYIHHPPQYRRVPKNMADNIHTVSRDRILPHTHGCAAEEDGQDLSRPPERDIADFDLIRRCLSMVFHSSQLKVELFAPGVDLTFNR